MYKECVMLIVLLILALIGFNLYKRESFSMLYPYRNRYYPYANPYSNCFEDIYGNIRCSSRRYNWPWRYRRSWRYL